MTILRTSAPLHRPLLWLAAAMGGLAVASVIGLVVDPRELTGAPLWAKPLKFAISTAIYSVTLAWLIGLLPRWRRTAWWAGTISAVCLVIEIVLIVGVAAAGTTSHFNVSSPFAAAVWSVMAVSIVVTWVTSAVVAVLLFRTRLGDAGRSMAIRTGLVIALIGMAIAFLMTSPTADQLNDYRGIAGAHTVGLADGGAGLPLLGWSTVAGDLRVPHFIGMHALQALPLAALALELLARRLVVLREERARARILAILAGLYAAVVAVVTVQALAGQSVVRPDVTIIAVTAGLFAAAALAVVAVLRAGRAALPGARTNVRVPSGDGERNESRATTL